LNPETTPAKPATEYEAVQDYLFGLKAQGPRMGIDRMRALVAEIGHPERALPMIHLTGTNGKGSTAAMLEAILREAGWRTGLYTSPHLVRLGERVQVDRRLLSEQELVDYCRELGPAAERIAARAPEDHPSFFEFMTAMAFLQFQRRGCDVGIIEVGMGGEFDATNVILPEVSVITTISLDHCEILGDTLEKIAATKSGIIKAGRPVVIGLLDPVSEAIIRGKAAALGAPVLSVREHYGETLEALPRTNLEGDYQRLNAATATLVCQALGPRWKLTPELISRGLQKVSWPGRWQQTRLGGRLLVLDASHNPEGAGVLEQNLAELVRREGRAPVVVTGVLGAARAKPLLEVLCRHAKELHLVRPKQARACTFEELESLLPGTFKGPVHRSEVEKLFPGPGLCTAGKSDDILLVTGSIYLLGEVLSRLEPERGGNEGRLQDF